MSEFEKAVTGLGEECGVFGAYDMDGQYLSLSCSIRLLRTFCPAAQRTGKLWYCSDGYCRKEKGIVQKRAWSCE